MFQVVGESLQTHCHDVAYCMSHLFWKWCVSFWRKKWVYVIYKNL